MRKNTAENCSNSSQSGSVSLVMIAFVVIAVSLTYAVVAVAENMILKKQANYGVQSSANAASYMYGDTLIKETKICVKKKIQEKLDESGASSTASDLQIPTSAPADQSTANTPVCKTADLQKCLDSDLKECSDTVSACWDGEDSPITTCQEDDEVKAKAFSAARSSAQSVADKYSLSNLQVQMSGEKITVDAQKDIVSQVPTFGVSTRVSVEAASAYQIHSGSTQ